MNRMTTIFGPASARSYKIGVVGNNNWLVGNAVFSETGQKQVSEKASILVQNQALWYFLKNGSNEPSEVNHIPVSLKNWAVKFPFNYKILLAMRKK